MPKTNSWLCQYAIAQIGKPYWYATQGQISTADLYNSTVKPALKSLGYELYSNYTSQLNVKVHDCAGLVAGALMCDTVDGAPSGGSPIATGATSQFNGNCSERYNSMNNFPYIPGTLVFVKGSNGVKTHVGIYVGTFIDKDGNEQTNKVVEAMGHAWGVTTSSLDNSKWGAWGQLACCTIDTTKNTKFDARTLTATSGAIVDGQSIIQTQNMKPFVATVLGKQYQLINYTKMKDARVSAMMFFGGELYNEMHIKGTYINPSLSKLVQDCNNAGMPWALYVNVRAKTLIEADEECRALYYVISRYSPTLGLWLSLQTTTNKDTTDKILDVYYKYIDKWGLKARCGMYLTTDQLSKFTWGKFQDKFYLWLIDPMNVEDVDDELLQPEMFEVPD